MTLSCASELWAQITLVTTALSLWLQLPNQVRSHTIVGPAVLWTDGRIWVLLANFSEYWVNPHTGEIHRSTHPCRLLWLRGTLITCVPPHKHITLKSINICSLPAWRLHNLSNIFFLFVAPSNYSVFFRWIYLFSCGYWVHVWKEGRIWRWNEKTAERRNMEMGSDEGITR